MLDEVTRPKTFSAWIIPGVITPPFILTKTAEEAAPIVLNLICEFYNVERSFIDINKKVKNANPKGQTRMGGRNDRVYLRQLFYYVMRDIYKEKATLVMLAKHMGQDHTTVMHSVKRFAERIFTDEDLVQVGSKKIGKGRKVRGDYYQLQNLIRPWL